MHQTKVVFTVLLKAHHQFAKSVVPRPGALDHPAPGRMSSPFGDRLSAPPSVRSVPASPDCRVDFRGVVPFIQAQMLGRRGGRARASHENPIQRGDRHPDIVDVGRGDNHRQGCAALVGQRVALGAEFAAIRRIGAGRRPPKGALTITLSSACHCQRMPWRSSYRVSSLAHNRSKTPAWTHCWNRRWQVEPDPYSLGRAFHWQPVRRTYKIPLRTWWKGTTGRPGVPGGFAGGSKGCSSVHTSSGMRQIVRRCRFVGMGDLCWVEGAINIHRQSTIFEQVLG